MMQALIRVATVTTTLCAAFSQPARAEEHRIHFDLAPIAVARSHPIEPTEASSNPVMLAAGSAIPMTFEIKLSSMIADPKTPRIDQWLVQCVPRDRTLLVADYAPKTELYSDYVGPMNVKRIDEKSDTFGLSVDGSYGHTARGRAGADHGRKSSESIDFQQHSPMQVVTAAGTIDRGRGVYYKLRWTRQQVLEGEKTFQITLAVSPEWRGTLVDVSVIAQTERKKLGGLDREIETLGKAHFTVAVVRDGDAEAERQAQALARAEDDLRRLARATSRDTSIRSLSTLLHLVAVKFDSDPGLKSTASIDRLVRGTANPYDDPALRKLPMELRVAALEYYDCRDEFESLAAVPRSSF